MKKLRLEDAIPRGQIRLGNTQFGTDRQTLPPPGPNAQGNMVQPIHPQENPAQQNLMRKREMMKQYEPVKRQILDLSTELENSSRTINRSMGALKTKQAIADAQQVAQIVTQIQQLLSQLPVLESKLNEDHGNVLERFAETSIERANQFGFEATMAIKGGDYQTAIELLVKSARNIQTAVGLLKRHIQKTGPQSDESTA